MPRRTLTMLLVAAAAVAALVASTASSAKPTVPPQDEMSLKSSIQGDRFEIIGGALAQKKGNNATIRALGKRLQKDHSKSLKETVKLAKSRGVSVPKKPTPSEQWELKVTGSFSGRAFDLWYSSLEVQDHKQDISEAKDELFNGASHEVRHSANKEIPTLVKHLKLSRAALKVAKGE